jgi:hypothetical protein
MPSSETLHRMALVRTDVWEECIDSIIRLTRIGELGITLTLTINSQPAVKKCPNEPSRNRLETI